jgi:hypothetical protein
VLERELSELHYTTFSEWAAAQDWSSLMAVSAASQALGAGRSQSRLQ